MNKKILAIAIVAIIIAASAAVVLTVNGKSNGFKPSAYPDSHLTVLGNADLDERISDSDVTVIENFISSGKSFDVEKDYMMDANNDGKIDQADVDKVRAMISALSSKDWSAVGTVHYVNVDYEIASYDMTKSNKVITLIAPPLDSVLAMGGKDLVVGFDNRITTGKYHSEYARTFDFTPGKMYDVGDCNEPSTQVITQACKDLGSVNVVCGTKDSYGPTMESVFKGTDVQVIRIASWEFGGTLYGFLTLGFLLKMTEGAEAYVTWYNGVHQLVEDIVASVPASKKAAGEVGATCAYGYLDELSLLGNYTGEYANLMVLDPYDSAEAYLKGKNSGGHGDTITSEGVTAMYQQYHLKHLLLMLGTPFQIYAAKGDAQATANNFVAMYKHCDETIGLDKMPGLEVSITDFYYSSGMSEVLNQLIQCYFMYHDEFLTYFKCSDDKAAHDVLAGYVDAYCKAISIDGLWSFYGEENGGKAGTHGMNLLYCGEGDSRNIMYGMDSGVLKF
ncbi:MAG: hypothetical protein MJZ38_04895 [archaeon]|nr:hypothetical protein [archaeon]